MSDHAVRDLQRRRRHAGPDHRPYADRGRPHPATLPTPRREQAEPDAFEVVPFEQQLAALRD
ncbi:hypothetical protein [Streptomyces anandii]|uniref:hypothetical protein n=1 Tax=Streptomyces anandii TaxID=285454 RepID=UPI0016772A83|nr:hypothetical protein [Streptomyces anandii]